MVGRSSRQSENGSLGRLLNLKTYPSEQEEALAGDKKVVKYAQPTARTSIRPVALTEP